MKVTVTFGDTAVVVPCKAEWTVRDLMEQATRRYRRILDSSRLNAMCVIRMPQPLIAFHSAC
uniref:Par3/HAL N-terminal domain-containing protein n=1 Tax=Mola mola TaxID=94237 RepID=A0A3Q4AUS0_MOLML